MKNIKVTAFLVAAFVAFGTSYAEDDLPTHLQAISVTIHANGSQGSGVIKTRGETNFVWTAAHVVSSLRTSRQVIDPKNGSTKTVIEFKSDKAEKMPAAKSFPFLIHRMDNLMPRIKD